MPSIGPVVKIEYVKNVNLPVSGYVENNHGKRMSGIDALACDRQDSR